MPVNFYELIGGGGLDEGRAVFEKLIVQVVRLKYPAIGITARPGDWGIDAMVGELDGTVSIWQSKYFIEGFAADQQQQVRESFKAARKAAEDYGHSIEAWTLCVPVEPDAPTLKWWQGWRKRQQRDTGVLIDLWSASTLEAMLLAPEAAAVFRRYFPKSAASLAPTSATLVDLPDDDRYDEALFIRQLREAGIAEHRSAKREFFNYEVLGREVADKAIDAEVEVLKSVQVEAHALWETRFVNAAEAVEHGRLPGLHGDVMRAIEDLHNHASHTHPPLSVVHRFGGMHRIVEDGEAGWVAHFRAVAKEHHGA
ncbi:MAG TPA: hypothetical protein VFT50_14505 [Baekduia sp.]|nr:hypothetical protein [Baekduia sp.]